LPIIPVAPPLRAGGGIVCHFRPQTVPNQTPMNIVHIRQSCATLSSCALMSKERPMPFRGFALTTILTALALGAAASDGRAQAPRQPHVGTPVMPRALVAGQSEEEAAPSLAQQAAESNVWAPCCEPPGPTKGLWGDCPSTAPTRSWQEYCMAFRDGLGSVFCPPNCGYSPPPPSRGSAWGWLTQSMLGLDSGSTAAPSTPQLAVPSPGRGSAWEWLIQWMPHLGSVSEGAP
jgi:hypothetical protein